MSELGPDLDGQESIEVMSDTKSKVSELLGVSNENVYDAKEEAGGRTRFEYFFVTMTDGSESFVKVAREPSLNINLTREATATQIARKLGVPTKDVYGLDDNEPDSLYSEIDGRGVIALELLDSKDWDFLATREQLASLDSERSSELIQSATRSLISFSGAEVPNDIDTESLRHDSTADWRYRSPEHNNKVWVESQKVVDEIGSIYAEDSDSQKQRIAALMNEGMDRIASLTEAPVEGKEYFVHGDFDPYNICVAKNKEEGEEGALILDFEHAGKTQFRSLAKLSDVSNFFGRLWPNPELQRSFITSYFNEEAKSSSLEASYNLTRSAIIFGTTYLAKYGMSPDHHEHNMSVTLLENLDNSLTTLDDSYRALTQEEET